MMSVTVVTTENATANKKLLHDHERQIPQFIFLTLG